MENRKEQQALQYFFRLLDVQGKSYLNVFALNYFFRVSIREISLSVILSCSLHPKRDTFKTLYFITSEI